MLDRISEYLASRKGLLPLLGIFFIIVNFILQFFPTGLIGQSNLFLHLGLVVAIFGLMLAWAL
ncbi:MAG TPA: hypothetical protein VMC09_01735 [Anaerolineales bacterium]|nr:hypothetical protein [Anaerolineales bacterium]